MSSEKMLTEVLRYIRQFQKTNEPLIIAIDGRCGSGKSTLGAALSAELTCNLIHMDDFYLRPEQRTPKRYAEPGGNVDRERFLSEVLRPLKENLPFTYRPLSCKTFTLLEPVKVDPSPITIIEGTYSCHPELQDYYDLRIFLTINPALQMERITARDPEKAEVFRSKWIPLEETYFEQLAPAGCCELVFDTGEL